MSPDVIQSLNALLEYPAKRLMMIVLRQELLKRDSGAEREQELGYRDEPGDARDANPGADVATLVRRIVVQSCQERPVYSPH